MRTNEPVDGFLGASVATDLSRLEAEIAILGVPHGSPYPRPGATAGCADAPAAVRARSQRLAHYRGHWDFDIDTPMTLPPTVDAGDVPGEASDGAGNAARTRQAVVEILGRGATPICIGGDDSVTIPVLEGFAEAGPITVVQVDAHLDFRDEVDGVRDGYSSPMRRASEMAHVERIIQVGLRGVGSARPGEVEDARAAGNVLLTARALHERGIASVLEHVPATASVVLAFDCDGLDPSVFPAVSAQAPGGVSYPDAVALLRGIGPRLAGAVFTEYVPALDVNELSALVLARLMLVAATR